MTKFVFFGTPEIAKTALEVFITKGLVPTLVVTGPAKPQGRGMQLTPTPVATLAEAHQIPTITPTKITPEVISQLQELGPWDCFIVVAYGKILPQALLDVAGGKVINIHPSLLPKYRGPSPIESVLLSDDTETGVTVMEIDALVDHGPIIVQEKFPLPAEMLRDELETLSATVGVNLIAATIDNYVSGMKLEEQDHELATHTKKITKADGSLDVVTSDWEKWKKYRALLGWPGVYFTAQYRGEPIIVKIKRAHWDNRFVIDEVVPQNQKTLPYEVFLKWIES